MTNITGKIYQMKNADGTENRFPRTVIEAVLGLSSYLQDQFSSLADIYMPIEGIYEALTGQEFVFRKSPNTIKAKSLTIDRIKGKTLAWNQLVSDLPLASGVYGGLTVTNNGDGSYTFNGTTTETFDQRIANLNIIGGHKYFVIGGIPNTTFNFAQAPFTTDANGLAITTPANDETRLYITIDQGVTFNNVRIYPQVTDLTLAEMPDITASEFLALYPGYHGYNPGTLISNDAEAVETTGVNQWDVKQAVDGKAINWQNGRETPAPGYSHTGYVSVLPNAAYYFKIGGNEMQWGAFYDSDKNYIGGAQDFLNNVFTTPENAAYIRISIPNSQLDTVCINISDPAIDGQYFPYWKRTLHLGLTTKEDTDGNVPFADGMKGAGTASDWADKVGGEMVMGRVDLGSLEWGLSQVQDNTHHAFNAIVPGMVATSFSGSARADGIISELFTPSPIYSLDYGDSIPNLTMLRTNGRIWVRDDAYSTVADFKAAMQGVMLDYELATPVPFTWAEPLINTVKAGTTEARISPNEDGLSAPFCCDMTYSASENNDSESAQYAATAGRLLNSHKIWGQDFNGSEDVDGNLVANGTIQGTQLKSTVTTGTAPLAVSSTTIVQNLVAEKASKLLTARTIWGQSFDGSGNISGAISNITTISASGLATISGGIALGTSTKAQAAKMVWDEEKNAWHLEGNLYVDGFVTAGGINNQE